MRTLIASIAVGLAVAVSLTAASSADARTLKAIWGPTELPGGGSAFPVYGDLGVDVLQVQLEWNEVARKRPRRPEDPGDRAYAWPPTLDATIAEARAHGVKIALMVRGAPQWSNGGRAPRWASAPAHYARFLTAASRRYPAVRRWMIWGEANRAAVFAPVPANRPRGPRTYARLLDAAYAALKRSSPTNVVVGGMTFSFGDVMPAQWLRWMRLPGGRRPRLDEYGHNPFSRRPPNLRRVPYARFPEARDISDLDTFAAEIRQAYRGQRGLARDEPRLWLSEFTVSSDRRNRAFDFSVSRSEQARWLRAAFAIADRVGASGLGWFSLLDEPRSVEGRLTTGLMTHDAKPKPAYRTYERLR